MAYAVFALPSVGLPAGLPARIDADGAVVGGRNTSPRERFAGQTSRAFSPTPGWSGAPRD